MLQHGVEHDQQLSHARGEHDLRGFPGRAQALGERANDGIAARRHDRGGKEKGTGYLNLATVDRLHSCERNSTKTRKGSGVFLLEAGGPTIL